MSVRAYYEITKPGIIYGNLFVAVGAFLLGAVWHINLQHLVGMMIGLSAIIGAGGVLNNYFDRDIDAVMDRTKRRASVTGLISPTQMLVYGVALTLLGSSILYYLVNLNAMAAALFGLAVYLGPYTLIAKRGSVSGTVIGSFSGAMPPVVGYVAATGQFDATALVVFCILFFWQMPHAYAIALYRFDDYKAANVPVLPVARGIRQTKLYILGYVLLFGLSAVALATIGAAGLGYEIIATLASLMWLALAVRGFFTSDWKHWGRQMFLMSLIILMLLFLVMAIDPGRGTVL